ncbi:hypothetical protein BKA65DRAFT_539995 [Rhexocercosporidium sp. MPI-PUGE-AT-0058]|nr:hypothetical protein BKA65DRAFT_539995 [Rhexocercosporidium sp. MPI-PUGE-AT-0058]
MASPINGLALTTGTPDVPARKIKLEYRCVNDKFTLADLTPVASAMVNPPGIGEYPVQMKGGLMDVHSLLKDVEGREGREGTEGEMVALEVGVLRGHVKQELRLEGCESRNRIDVEKWRSMVMRFHEIFGLEKGRRRSRSLRRLGRSRIVLEGGCELGFGNLTSAIARGLRG